MKRQPLYILRHYCDINFDDTKKEYKRIDKFKNLQTAAQEIIKSVLPLTTPDNDAQEVTASQDVDEVIDEQEANAALEVAEVIDDKIFLTELQDTKSICL
jgi:predicted ATPase with chaperone activity